MFFKHVWKKKKKKNNLYFSNFFQNEHETYYSYSNARTINYAFRHQLICHYLLSDDINVLETYLCAVNYLKFILQ
jgi:hypothetical protein